MVLSVIIMISSLYVLLIPKMSVAFEDYEDETVQSVDNDNISIVQPPLPRPPINPICKEKCFCDLVPHESSDQLRCSSSISTESSLRNFGEYICPQQFRNLADYVFMWEQTHHKESLAIPEFYEIESCIPEGGIIYVRSWFMNEFFDRIYPDITKSVVLLTGEGDLTVPYTHHIHYIRGRKNESRISHWFGQNGMAKTSYDRLTHIPIGLNCREHVDSLNTVKARYLQNRANMKLYVPGEKSQYDPEDPYITFPMEQDINNMTKLLLLNFDPGTDGSGTRRILWDKACSNSGANPWAGFSMCISKETGVVQYVQKLPDIYEQNMKFPFWLSPRGNGVDCHRTWEALYLGRIPIVLSSEIDDLFTDLPVLIVKDWGEISETFLRNSFNDIMERRRKRKFNYNKLKMSYWSKVVLSESAHQKSPRQGRCWNPN